MLCIASGTNLNVMKTTLEKMFGAVRGSLELKYDTAVFQWFDPCMTVSVKYHGKWTGAAGCGIMTSQTLRDAGYDPQTVGGFAIALNLDRLAMLKYGIDDVRKLWQPPYVPG